MKDIFKGKLIRIFISENDKHSGRPLYEAIVDKAFKMGLAGATVLRGVLGFGSHNKVHTAKILRLSEELPIIIEIVDDNEKIDRFVSEIDPMINGGIITVEKIDVMFYK